MIKVIVVSILNDDFSLKRHWNYCLISFHQVRLFDSVPGAFLKSATVAIFTPTFNRAYKLPDLYHSLVRQTNKDFVWLVVDDGSTDDTDRLINNYMHENLIKIRFVSRENGGKQRAHNTALQNCNEELFFTVDSDDYLTDSAIQQVIEAWTPLRPKENIAGIIALCGESEIKPLNTYFPAKLNTTKIYDLYSHYHFAGDATLIYRTSILKQYPYDVAEGEKFIAESFVYLQIDERYELSTLNSVLKICEYLPDGYTKSTRSVARLNPKGYMKVKKMYMERATTHRDTIESTTLYLVGAYFAHEFSAGLKTIRNPALAIVAGFIAIVLANTEFRK